MTPDSAPPLARILLVASRVTGAGSRSSPPPEHDVTPETRLADLGVTSYLLFQFIRELESEFRVRIGDDDLEYSRFETVGHVSRLVDDYRRSRARPGLRRGKGP